MTSHRQPPTRQRGIALLIVLWGLALVTILALTVTTESRSNLLMTRNVTQAAKARAAAEAGVHRALVEMLASPETRRWNPTGERYRGDLGANVSEARYAVRILDETGRIDLNTVDPALLGSLIEQLAPEADANALVDAFADFRDDDDLTQPFGMEDADYAAAGLAWDAKDKSFEHVAELAQVPGFTSAVLARLAPHLTVYSRQREVRLEAATPELQALLAGDYEALQDDQALSELEGEAGLEGEDGAPADALLDELAAEESPDNEGFARGRIYAIESTGIVGETRVTSIVHVVLTGTNPPWQFIARDDGTLAGLIDDLTALDTIAP